MELRTYKVFKFEELDEATKQKAIDKWYEAEDYPFLEEDIRAELEHLDTFKLFSDVRLQYSLSYCQGDGLSFSAQIDLEAYLKSKKWKEKSIKKLTDEVYKFYSKGNQGRYSYASKSDIEYETQGNVIHERIEAKLDVLKDEIAEYYLNICRKLEKYGYSILEYRMDFKEFAEHCEANGYMFTENGQID